MAALHALVEDSLAFVCRSELHRVVRKLRIATTRAGFVDCSSRRLLGECSAFGFINIARPSGIRFGFGGMLDNNVSEVRLFESPGGGAFSANNGFKVGQLDDGVAFGCGVWSHI